jgi:hypothetical protein
MFHGVSVAVHDAGIVDLLKELPTGSKPGFGSRQGQILFLLSSVPYRFWGPPALPWSTDVYLFVLMA